MFKDGSLSLGYQWKVNTHGSPDARQWTIVSAESTTIGGQSYSFGSPGKSLTGGTEGMLATLGNSLFDLFKSGTRDFGGHIAANFTVALGPRVKDAINSYMEHAFGDYSKQLNQDTKSLDKSNGLLQNELKSNANSGQLGTESGRLQKDTAQFQKGTAQGIQDLLDQLGRPPQPPKNPAPALPPARENGPAAGTAPSIAPPLGQNPAGAPPRPGGLTRPGDIPGFPQSGPAATPPGSTAAPGSAAQPDTNPDGTLNTPPLDRSEPDSTPFQSAPPQPATPGPDPAQPPVIVPPVVADNSAPTQPIGEIPDPTTPVIAVSAPAPPQIAPVPIPVADPISAPTDTADATDDGIPAGDLGVPADLSGDTGDSGTVVADAGIGDDGGGDG